MTSTYLVHRAMCCFEIFRAQPVLTDGGSELYRVVTLKTTPRPYWCEVQHCVWVFGFPFRRYQHMQHSVEQHRCNFWINTQPLMALQEVNSLIPVSEKQSRQQTELSAAARHRAGCSTVFPPPASRRRQQRRASSLPDCSNYPQAGWHCKEILAPTSVTNVSWLCQMIFTLVGAPFDRIISWEALFHLIRLVSPHDALFLPACPSPNWRETRWALTYHNLILFLFGS